MTDDNLLTDVAESLKAEYPQLSVHEYNQKARLTNGSAAWYIDIYPTQSGMLMLEGERYGERIYKRCDRDTAALLHTLRGTI